jgi:hypothetical protein
MNALCRILVVPLAVASAACTPTVSLTVDSDVPEALVDRYPINVGVYYDESFENYVYKESSEDRGNWSIDSGAEQVELFDQMLESMFLSVRRVDGPPGPGQGIDAVVSPKIEDMQFAMPKETGFEFYEAWIKYRINLYEPDGKPIADWVVTAYGKAAPEKSQLIIFENQDASLNEAIGVALRDAGAKISLGFSEIPEVKDWLAKRSP